MSFQLGARALPRPTQQMSSNASSIGVSGVGLHSRAYGKITLTGGGIVKCSSSSFKSIESITNSSTHADLLTDDSGRLTPFPVLESISINNDGGQDISDAMLFEASCNCKVYNQAHFDHIEKNFMTPRQRVKITIGWVGGNAKTVTGEITGFNFTINSDLSYDVSLKVAGAADGVLDVDYMTLKDVGKETVKDPESGKEVPSTDLITNLVGISSKLTGKPAEGKAQVRSGGAGKPKIGLVNHQMVNTGWSSFFNSATDNVLPYVRLDEFIDYVNKNSKSVAGTAAQKFDYSKIKIKTKNDSKIASANPLEMIFGWASKYGPNADYSALTKGSNPLAGIWVQIGFLQTTMKELKNPPGKEDSPNRIATSMFLKKIFNKINENSGGYLTLFLYNDPDSDESEKGKFLILNKGTAAKKQVTPTTIELTKGFKNGVRDCSLTSNLDSDLIALATAAAMDGEGSPQLDAVFGGCYPGSIGENANDYAGDLAKAIESLGDNISEDDITGAKQALKAYVKNNNKKYNPNISYGLECELTVDGYNLPKYGDCFSVDRLPSRIKNKAYFIVTKIGQEFNGGDWSTKISGLMMIDA